MILTSAKEDRSTRWCWIDGSNSRDLLSVWRQSLVQSYDSTDNVGSCYIRALIIYIPNPGHHWHTIPISTSVDHPKYLPPSQKCSLATTPLHACTSNDGSRPYITVPTVGVRITCTCTRTWHALPHGEIDSYMYVKI